MDESLPSVRIDIDSTSSVAAPDAPQAGPGGGGERGRNRSVGVVVSIAALLGIVAVLVLALRPGDGETAAGTQRQPTTTTTTTIPTTSTTGGATDDDSETQAESNTLAGVEIVELDTELEPFGMSFVEDDLGYWLMSPDFANGAALYRSLDGVIWTEVEWGVRTDDDPVSAEALYEPEQLYAGLVGTESGLAMLRQSVEEFSRMPTSSLQRLESTDGVTWDVASTFADASDRFGSALWLTAHSEVAVAYMSESDDEEFLSEGDPRFAALLSAVLLPEVELPGEGVCYADFYGGRLTAYSCGNFGTSVALTDEDFVEPELFQAAGRCANWINDSGWGVNLPVGRTVQLLREGITNEFESAALPIDAGTASDGTIFAIDPGEAESIDACDGLIETVVARSPAVEIWHPDGTLDSIPFPGEVTVQQFQRMGPPVMTVDTDGELYLPVGADVWYLDQATGEWELRVSLSGVSEWSYRPVRISNGRAVAAIRNHVIQVGDLATGEVTTIRYREAARHESDDTVVHVDDTYAFVANYDGELIRVTLPDG